MLDIRYRTILSVAIPLMGSTFIQSIVLITDSSFLSRYDTEAFDAAGNGGLIFITLFMIMVGLNDGLQIILARRIGEKQQSKIPSILGSAIISNITVAVLLFIISMTIAPAVIRAGVGHAPLGELQIQYVGVRSYGLFFSFVSLALNALFLAHGKTLIVFIGATIAAISNIGLDYVMIFGKLGFPEMGLSGAAFASVLSDGTNMIVMIVALITIQKGKNPILETKIRFSTEHVGRLLKVGSPIMLQGLVALSTWTIFFFWIEQIGTYELTVSQNIRSLYFLAFVPIWGFGVTARTYVSQYIGNNKEHELKKITGRIQFLTLIFLLLIFHGAILYPERMVSMINPDPQFLEESSNILQFIFGSILIYGFFNVYFQTISGSGNTRYTFYVEVISVAIYLICCYIFIKVLQWEIFWIWTVEYIYFGVLGLLSIIYLSLFDWKKKLV